MGHRPCSRLTSRNNQVAAALQECWDVGLLIWVGKDPSVARLPQPDVIPLCPEFGLILLVFLLFVDALQTFLGLSLIELRATQYQAPQQLACESSPSERDPPSSHSGSKCSEEEAAD